MNNILWFDLETTGTDPVKNGIIQIAAMIERDGEIIDTFNEFQNPVACGIYGRDKIIDSNALIVNGITLEAMSFFQVPRSCYAKFNAFLDKNGFRGVKSRRFIPAGYNAVFDLDFLKQFFLEMSGGPYAFWEHLQYKPLDPYPVVVWLWRQGLLDIPDCKLSTVARHFGIEIQAHDALSDILAARSVSHEIRKVFSSENIFGSINKIKML